ncbi:MAG: hypothetical protein PF904_02605 [Kiritimatiellae bacterium]|jgi:hypothetical protein|nr:hypothetical protein [Kiritimatiellia bacterium]
MNKNNIQITLKNKAASISRDVVGIEVGANLPQGAPVVRLHVVNKQVELLAVGFVKLPEKMPESISDLEDNPTKFWTLPKEFQASKAAIAVTSKDAVIRQTSDTSDNDDKKIPIRKILYNVDVNHPPIISSMPEFLASWIATRFPEGHRPTIRSIQTSATAVLNCFLCGPVTASSDKPTGVIFCFKHHSAITMFYENRLVLHREHPVGYMTIKEALSKNMGIDISMVDTIIDDPALDISPIISPILETLFRQVDISADYLARRKDCTVENFYIYGLPCGSKHWTSMFTKLVNKPLNNLHPFGGISCNNKKLLLPDSFKKDTPLFMSAVGAARALLEDL